MNCLGFAFPVALLITVHLDCLTWAATNPTETPGKDYKEQPEHLSEQPIRRSVPACSLGSFSLGGVKPTFPDLLGVTLSICQDKQYATFYNNDWGIARYAVYRITPAQATAPRVDRPNDPWKQTPNQGTTVIKQGSTKLYESQPKSGEYHRGHLVPVDILRYSEQSVLATFSYTNCVPQIGNFNSGQWKKYETKINNYASSVCAPKSGTLYLITGTSQVKFDAKLDPQGKITGAVTSVQSMAAFHDNVDKNPKLGPKIAIPNSMWTVGCCLSATNVVVGAFGVMGTNALDKPLNVYLMPKGSVAKVEKTLQLEDPTIKLFHNTDCYKPEKNVVFTK